MPVSLAFRRRLLAAGLLAGLPRAAPGADETARFDSTLLVATPALGEGLFARTVILAAGTPRGEVIGLILNRPSPEPLPDWAVPRERPERVSGVQRGGPLAPDQLFALAEGGVPGEGSLAVGPTLRLAAGARAVRAAVGASVGRVRLFRGYAGWAAGQLAREMAGGFWQPRAVDPDLVYAAAPDTLWQQLGGGAA